MREYHVVAQVFVVVQVEDGASEEGAAATVEEWLAETCPFEEMEVDTVEATLCTADVDLRRMQNAPNN